MSLPALIVAVGFVAATATPVVAVDVPTTKVECERAGMIWKQKANKCRPEDTHTLATSVRNVLGVIGVGCAVAGVVILLGAWRRT